MTARSQRAGRKDGSERVRELVSVLGALSRTGDIVTIGAIAKRMGMSEDEATSLMDIVCQASGEESGGLLISANDEMTEFVLEYPGIKGRPLRLTHAESMALVHGLDATGIPVDDPIRVRLRDAFLAGGIADERVRKALGSSGPSDDGTALNLCAHATAHQRSLSFLYQGMADSSPRERRAAPISLVFEQGTWYVIANDLDLGESRTFRIDRMQGIALGPRSEVTAERPAELARRVRVTFLDTSYITMLDWPGLRIIRKTGGKTYCDIPYYAGRSTWLARRVLACNGALLVDDDRIMQDARRIAAEEIGRHA